MCLILFSLQHHRGYPVIIAANRDERYERRSAALGFWPDAPHVAGGRDLEAGGTWLGITRAGRWAALTNFRQPGSHRGDAPSRGRLVSDYLLGTMAPAQYLARIEPSAHAYNGFNLLVGDLGALHYLSNCDGGARRIEPGVHGVSNHLLNTPWPKVALGRKYLQNLPLESSGAITEALLERLRDATRPADADLPDIGIGPDRERALSPPFIEAEHYGTRASTVIVVNAQGEVTIRERRFGPFGTPLGSSELDFRLDSGHLPASAGLRHSA
ncbi:MAG: hypothetical protein GEV05_20245 [Betaproteobacteria bacterium]|nr:hypothetical protein [Betaproteobacteria bacterium]